MLPEEWNLPRGPFLYELMSWRQKFFQSDRSLYCWGTWRTKAWDTEKRSSNRHALSEYGLLDIQRRRLSTNQGFLQTSRLPYCKSYWLGHRQGLTCLDFRKHLGTRLGTKRLRFNLIRGGFIHWIQHWLRDHPNSAISAGRVPQTTRGIRRDEGSKRST